MFQRYIKRRPIHSSLAARNNLQDFDLSSEPRPVACIFLIAGWHNIGPLDHQNDGSLGRARTMLNAPRDDKTLLRSQIDGSTFQIDQETAFYDVKEFIDVGMFVPMVFTFDNSEPNDGIIHLAQGLVPPLVFAFVDQLLNVDQLERSVQNVQVSFVGKTFRFLIRCHNT